MERDVRYVWERHMLLYLALSGLTSHAALSPRASPWAMLYRAVGAPDGHNQKNYP